MNLLLVPLSFFMWMHIAYAQSEIDWRAIHAEESLMEFNRLERLFPESHDWDPDDRVAYLKKTFRAAQQLQVDSLICYYGEKLGTLYREMDSLGQALQIFNISYEFANKATEKRIILNSLGGLHIKNGDYNTALDYYFEAVEIAKKLNDGSEAYPIGNISEVYAKLGDYENSAKYLNYSLGLSDKLKSPEKEYSLIYDYSYLVNTYQKLNKQDSAKFVVQQTLKHLSFLDTFPEQKYKDASFIGYYAIAEYYIKKEIVEEAKAYTAKADQCAQILYKSSIKELEARIEMVKGNYSNALRILSGDIIQNEFYDKAKIIELQGVCYKALGNYSKAMELREKEIAWLKKNNSQDQLKYSSFANAKYELLQKNEAIKNLTQEKEIDSLTIKNQKYILYLSMTLFGLFASGAFFYWKQYKNRKELSLELQKQVESKTENLVKVNHELKVLNYVASHDLKEPMRNIGNFIGLLNRKIPKEGNEEIQEYFSTIQTSLNQLYTLVEDIGTLLSMSDDDQIEYSEVDLNKVVSAVSFSLEKIIKEKEAIIVNKQLPIIVSNNTIIFILLKNLIENGIKFNESKNPTVSVDYKDQGENHLLIVSDNGIGIDKKYHDLIFERFKRLHDRSVYQGSGIGLSIVKVMVEKLKASVEIESNIGQGTMFKLKIPKESISIEKD